MYCAKCHKAGFHNVFHSPEQCWLTRQPDTKTFLKQFDTGSQQQMATRIYSLVCHRFEDLWLRRHDYPLWPEHDEPMDALEREIHGPVRQTYYDQFRFLIELMRIYRTAQKPN